eukprot:6197948-Pleurochrysis_carterae.AAC.1
MASVNVLCARMVLRVVGKVDGSLIVDVEGRRRRLCCAELVEKRAQVDGLFGGFGGGHDLSLAT